MDLPHSLGHHRPPQIGVLVLSADETLEPDFRRLLPPPVEVLAARVPSGDHVLPETLAAMDGTLAEAAGRFPEGAAFASVGYACTSATAQIGAERLHGQITAGLGAPCPVTDPVTATLAAFRALGVSRIGLVSPYVEAVSARLIETFAASGLRVTRFGSFNVSEEARVVRIAPGSIRDAALAIGDGDCEAVFLSCTNLRTLDVIDPIEAALGNVMRRSVGEAGDILRPVLGDDEDVVLAVAARARLALGDRQHRLHRDHHAGFQHRVDILAQFQPRPRARSNATEHAEGMPVAEGAVLQQVALREEGVDRLGDLGAAGAGLQKAHPKSWAATLASQMARLASSTSPTNSVRSSAV
jgi:maleate isomerase